MAQVSTIKVPMAAAVGELTLKVVVTGAKRARLRLWLGAHVIRAAAVIIGCGLDVTVASPAVDADGFRSLDGGRR